MTAAEKRARELRSFFASEGIDYGPSVSSYFLRRLARHVLRRERAAVRRATKYRKAIVEHMVRVTTERSAKPCICRSCLTHVNHLARVVAVPRKGGRK